MSIQYINKENINSIRFTKQEVHNDEARKKLRADRLKKALALGNLYKNHVRITFVTAEGKQLKTEATVWAVTENYVILKSHMMIPIISIQEVELV